MRNTNWIRIKDKEKEKKRQFLRKPCIKCGLYFERRGKFVAMCDECKKHSYDKK